MKLEELIKQKKWEMKDLDKELDFLKRISLPLNVHESSSRSKFCRNGYRFTSTDYSLATDYSMQTESRSANYYSCSGHRTKFIVYPQFYFQLKIGREKGNIVYVEIEPKKSDMKNLIIKRYTRDVENHEYDRIIPDYVDIKKVISFLKRKKVCESLIEDLQQKILGM